jgi:hypothetical protein
MSPAISGYSLSTSGNSLLLVKDKSAPTITVTPNAGGYVYSGSSQGPGTIQVSTGGSTGTVTLSYAGTTSSGVTYGPSGTAPTLPGSYNVTATVAADSNYLQGISPITAFTIEKADASVTWPTASAITAGQALISSTLSGGSATGVGGASVAGAFAWTSGTSTPSATGGYAVTFTPTSSNYNTAIQTVSLTVNSAGPTFASAFGGASATDVGADGMPNLLRYAMGASSASALVVKPVSSMDANSLSITVNVRTNDPKVTVVGESATDITVWNTTPITGVPTADQTGASAGTQNQSFSVQRGSNARMFLRLKAIQQN